jgi:hypothetical protein
MLIFRKGSDPIVIPSKRFCAARDLGEPRVVARFLRHDNRAFGSLPYRTAPLPQLSAHVGSKLKCPVLVAREMSGFKVVPSPIGLG